jgi:hypothetical protein
VASPAVWLLDFEVGGQLFRYSTEPARVLTLDGRTLVYRPGLTDFELDLTGFEVEVGVEVEDRTVSWALVAARVGGLEHAPATLRYWRGELLEQARVVLQGYLAAPQYGDPNRPGALVATVQEPRELLFPPATETVSETTFLNEIPLAISDEKILGAVYPYVFGYPGYFLRPDGSVTEAPAVPALLVRFNGTSDATDPDASHVMVCARQAHALTSAGTVKVWNGETNGVVPIEQYVNQNEDAQLFSDLTGRAYTAVGFTIGEPIYALTGVEFHTSWSPVAGRGGGLALPDRSGPVRTLTDVLLFALTNSGRRVDLDAQEGERDELDRFLVDGFLNDRILLTEWVEAQLARLFPLARTTTSRGMYWRYVPWSGDPTRARAQLTTRDVRRVGPIQSASDQVANLFTLRYAPDGRTRAHLGLRVLGAVHQQLPVPERSETLVGYRYGNPNPTPDERVIGSPLCAASMRRYGLVERDPVETALVWDTYTASSILQHWAERDCFPRRWVEYQGAGLSDLRRADLVTITDDELGLDEAVALVDSVSASSRRLQTLRLEVLDPRFRSTS